MEYDAKKRIIDELSKQMTGISLEESKAGKVITKIDGSTGSTTFILSGSEYTMAEMSKARKYLSDKAEKHSRAGSERHGYYDIAVMCIDAVIGEFTKPVDDIIESTKIN